jgi:hypothetical protein
MHEFCRGGAVNGWCPVGLFRVARLANRAVFPTAQFGDCR